MLRTIADGLLSVLLAPACAACDVPLDEPSRGPVCSTCWAGIVPFRPPLCRHCGDPLPSWRVNSIETSTCARCRRRPSAISRSRAIGAYEGSLRAIVHALKYDGRRTLAAPLAARLRGECADILEGADVLVPVPLHPRRQRARGFNQAEELARSVAALAACPSNTLRDDPRQSAPLGASPSNTIRDGPRKSAPRVTPALRRIRSTPSQTDLPAAQRHANVKDAFRLHRRTDVRGLSIVLVDDVCTTGATLEACAAVLREAGAADVRAITAARVVSRAPQ